MPVQRPSVFEELKKVDALVDQRNEPEMVVERLPFTVRKVTTPEQLSKVLRIRAEAYSRHMPEFGPTLRQAEAMDGMDAVVILVAESKLDGSPLGTMRIQTNQFRPLALEQSIDLPPDLRSSSLAEATRLAVIGDKVGSLVKTVLFKSYFLFCQAAEVEWMVVSGRSPVDRQYQRLLFSDVVPGLGYIPMRHVNNIPHRIMSFEIGTAQERWRVANHPLYDFVFHTNHPDIQIEMPLAPHPHYLSQPSAHNSAWAALSNQ